MLPVSATSRRLSACRPRGRLPGPCSPCSPCHPLPHPQPSRMLPHALSTAVLTCLLLEPSPSKRRCRRDHTTALLGYLEAADYQKPVHALPPASSSLVYSFPFSSPPFPPQCPSRNHWLLQDTRPPSVPSLGPWSSQPRPPFPLPVHGSCFHLPITASPSAPWHLFCAPRDRDPLHVTLRPPLVTPWTSERRGREARTCTGSRPRAAGPQGAGGSGR